MLEELNELVKEYTEKETGVKSINIEASEVLERVKNIDEGKNTTSFIYISDNGMSVDGATPDIMNLLSLMVRSLLKHGMDRELIEKSVQIGLATDKEKLEMLSELLENITKKMEEK